MPDGRLLNYVALLRAINVGGHVVKMDKLKRLFESLGLKNVATFIASGNVYFESPTRDAEALERRIESCLREALGYDVATFIRSVAELSAIAEYRPFRSGDLDGDGVTLFIGFLHAAPAKAVRSKVTALGTKDDTFHLYQRELYWLRGGRFSDSPFSGALLEKALGMPTTLRNANTVRRLAAKYGA